MKYRAIKILFVAVMLLTLLAGMTSSVYAADPPAETGTEQAEKHPQTQTKTEQFEGLSGNGKYLGKDWHENYALDTEETGILDAGDNIGNSVANLLFTMDSNLAYMGMRIFKFALSFDLVSVFKTASGSTLNDIQQTMKDSIFTPLFLIGFAACAWKMIKQMLRRNAVGLFGEVCKVLAVLIISTLLVTQTADLLSKITGYTKELGLSVITQINGQESTGVNTYADQTAGVLWSDLIHQPWLAMEFQGGDAPTTEEADAILGAKPNTEERQNAVNTYIANHPGSFNKSLGWSRLGLLLIYFFPMTIKLAVYIACAFVLILFQLLAIFYVLLGPLFLILSMFDTFGGMQLITLWGKKIIETQITILITTILLGLLILVGNLINTATYVTMGWLLGVTLQSFLLVGAFLARKPLMRGLRAITHQPAALPQTLINGNPANVVNEVRQDNAARNEAMRQKDQEELIRQRDQQQLVLGDKDIEVRTMQVEKLEREKVWDETHPNANPHDKNYHHYYRPSSESAETRQAREAASVANKAMADNAETRDPRRPHTQAPAGPTAQNPTVAPTAEAYRPSTQEGTRSVTATAPISRTDETAPVNEPRRPRTQPEPVGKSVKDPWEAHGSSRDPWEAEPRSSSFHDRKPL